MLKYPTVFVIGAGAGVDIGMPTGAKLMEELSSKLDFFFKSGGELERGSLEIAQALRQSGRKNNIQMNDFVKAGRSIAQGIGYARSIDSYIHTHKDDEAIKICGKVGIVHTILAYERESQLFVDEAKGLFRFKGDLAVKRSWLSDFMYLLSSDVGVADLDTIFDNLTIINFNYDRCVEHFLYWALQQLYRVDRERAAELMKKAIIFHPYGVVSKLQWQQVGGLHFGGDPHGMQLDLAGLAENIRTFNEEVENSASLAALRKRFIEAARVIFLGFHFHPQNLALLECEGMEEPVTITRNSSIYASLYDRSDSDQSELLRRLNRVFAKAGVAMLDHTLRKDCKALFKEFGTVLGG